MGQTRILLNIHPEYRLVQFKTNFKGDGRDPPGNEEWLASRAQRLPNIPRGAQYTELGAAFFEQVCLHRADSEPMFLKKDGSVWHKSHQLRPMNEACRRGKIEPPINFHTLRHTWASLATMNGVPLLIVAKNLGHSGWSKSTTDISLRPTSLTPSVPARRGLAKLSRG